MVLWRTLGQWRRPSASNAWSPRDGAGLLSLGDDLYLLGGWNPSAWPSAPGYTVNEVWRSSNRGQTWTQLRNAPWSPRHSAGWLVHDNKIWVIGGDANSGVYQRDIWNAEPDGLGDLNWTEAADDAEPLTHGRVLHQVFSHAGKLWIVGGQTLDEFAVNDPSTKPGSPYYDDTWSSVDGADWEQVSTGGGWAPRSSIIGSISKGGHMWLVAGGGYDTQGYPRSYKNDIWRASDGTDWTQVVASAPFPPRMYNTMELLGEDMVLFAGFDGTNRKDAWASMDGINWRELRGTPWQVRHAASGASHKGEIFMLGGPLTDTAVWALS